MPCRQKTCLTRRSAVSLEEGSLGRATKWAALEKQSITVRMVVLPSDVGRPVTKLRASCTSRDKRTDVLDHGGPPNTPADEIQGAGYSRVAGKPGGVRPGQNTGPNRVRNEHTIRGAETGVRLLPLRKADRGLHLPGECGNEARGWQNGLGVCAGVHRRVQAGESIRLDILGTGTVSE